MGEVVQTLLFHEKFQFIGCDVSKGHFPFGGCAVHHGVEGVCDVVVIVGVVVAVVDVIVVAVLVVVVVGVG